MSHLTPVFLVLLRLAIGWHLLFAGIDKVRKDSWSSEGYLREASGPFGPTFREIAGDGGMAAMGQGLMPEGLENDWNAYREQFVRFYELDDQAREQAQAKLNEQKEQFANWLLTGTKKVRRTSPGGPSIDIELTTTQRLQGYQENRAELQRLQKEEIVSAEGTIYQELGQKSMDVLKAEVNRMRADLSADLTARTGQMKTSLRGVLTPQQLLDHGDMPDPPHSRWKQWQRWREWTRLDWTDALVVGGLIVVGGLLMVGLFTRTACVLGAVLLLMFYLTAMPIPGLPETLRGEGYPFVNKNLVEMLALLALATTRSGRWVGLDGLVQFLNLRRWRRRSTASAPFAF